MELANSTQDWATRKGQWRRLRKNSQEGKRKTGRTGAGGGGCFRRKALPNHIVKDLLTRRAVRILIA